jgi:ADP-ribosyl-[dinitrogen reductase] hydrolase
MTYISLQDRFRGALLGLACGDAVGTTVEFKRRGTFEPVTAMAGGGPFRLNPGEWTDDTSMALCLATSLVEKQGFHAHDQMSRYVRWTREGYLSSNGTCFDVGMTVMKALGRFRQTGDPFSGSTEPNTAGNGCLMRLAPVPMFYFLDRLQAIEMSGESSRTTHAALECVEASRLFGAMLHSALSGAAKDEILLGHGLHDFQSPSIMAIANGDYRHKDVTQIKGSGYVVESLEAALWCFHNSGSFETAVLTATNLGHDADTTAAICGQLSGAFYGEENIPRSWRNKLAYSDMIRTLADKLFVLGNRLEMLTQVAA